MNKDNNHVLNKVDLNLLYKLNQINEGLLEFDNAKAFIQHSINNITGEIEGEYQGNRIGILTSILILCLDMYEDEILSANDMDILYYYIKSYISYKQNHKSE